MWLVCQMVPPLKVWGRFRQQRPHFRHFIGPDAKGVGQIFYDPVVVQVPLAPNCNDVVLTFMIFGIY